MEIRTPWVAGRKSLGRQSWSVKENRSLEEEEKAPEERKQAVQHTQGQLREMKNGNEEHLRVARLRGSSK